MPSILDVFTQDAFSLFTLTDAVNSLDYLPTRTRDLGIFEGVGIDTTNITIEEKSGTLSLVETSERGSPPKTRHEGRRTVRTLRVPHLALSDRILADSIQNVRAFGTDNVLETIQGKVNARLEMLRRDIEATQENLRLGALKGRILDADGSTIYDLFTEFGVSPLEEALFEFDNAELDVRGICQALRRSIARELGAMGNGGFRIHALCSPEFFDALINHDQVKDTYKNWSAAEDLRRDKTYTVFPFAGIDFEDYRGSDDGASIAIDQDCVHFFPIVRGLYRMYFAPADYIETVNTQGRPFYAKQASDQQWNKYVDLEVQSNPLPICLKPRVLVKGSISIP